MLVVAGIQAVGVWNHYLSREEPSAPRSPAGEADMSGAVPPLQVADPRASVAMIEWPTSGPRKISRVEG